MEHHLSDLVARVNDAQRRAAMEKYLNGDAHWLFQLTSVYDRQCEKFAEDIKEGQIMPQLGICSCGDTFAALLTSPAYIIYDGCDLLRCDDEDPDITFEEDPAIDDKTYAQLEKLSADKLLEALTDEPYECVNMRYVQHHAEDKNAQLNYYNQVIYLIQAAGERAAKIGAYETARKWLEAERLLQPQVTLSCTMPKDPRGLKLIPENVAKAYRVAEEAHAMLWADERCRARGWSKKPAKKGR